MKGDFRRINFSLIVVLVFCFMQVTYSDAYAYKKQLVKKTISLVDEILDASKVSGDEIQSLSRIKILPEINKAIQHYPEEAHNAIYLAISIDRKILNVSEALKLLQN